MCARVFSLARCLCLSLSVFLSLVMSPPLFISVSVFFSHYLCLFTSLSLFFFFASVSVALTFTSYPSPATTTQHVWAGGLFPPNSSPLAAAQSFLASPARPSWALEEGGEGGREGSLAGPPLFAFPGWEAGPVGLLTSLGRLCRTSALDSVPGSRGAWLLWFQQPPAQPAQPACNTSPHQGPWPLQLSQRSPPTAT